MKQELKHIEPLRAANVGAVVYGLLTFAFALLFLPFVLLITSLAPSQGLPYGGPLIALFILVFYPLLGLVMGWISGLLSAAIYNFVIRWTGGVLVELDSVG